MRVSYKEALDIWRSGELSDAVLFGAITYDITNGSSLGSGLVGPSPTPTTRTMQLGKGISREIVQSRGSVEQLLNVGGLRPDEVNKEELFKSGIELGLPKVTD